MVHGFPDPVGALHRAIIAVGETIRAQATIMGYADCFAGFVADVYAAIRAQSADKAPSGNEDGAPAFPTFGDAARTVRLTEAVLRSARSRSWIEVPR